MTEQKCPQKNNCLYSELSGCSQPTILNNCRWFEGYKAGQDSRLDDVIAVIEKAQFNTECAWTIDSIKDCIIQEVEAMMKGNNET